jgi:hypothetical protein
MTRSMQIQKAADAFAATHRGAHNQLMQLEAKFKGRGIQPEDFAKFRAYSEEYTQSIVARFRGDYEYKKRDASLMNLPSASFLGVGFSPNTHDDQTRMVVPRVHIAVLSPILFTKIMRNFPVGFEIQKAEFEYIRNTTETMNYEDEATQQAFVLGLAMSKVLEQKLGEQDGAQTRFALPHPEGLLMGTATRIPKEQQYWACEATRFGKNGGRPVNLNTAFQSEEFSVEIQIEKFVHPRRLTPAQFDLWGQTVDFIGERNKEQIDAVWARFAGVTAKSDFANLAPKAQELHDALTEVVNSDTWSWALGLRGPKSDASIHAEPLAEIPQLDTDEDIEDPQDGLMRFMMRAGAIEVAAPSDDVALTR